MTQWKCAGCGVVSEDLARRCDCVTEVLYAWEDGGMKHEVKLPKLFTKAERTALSRLHKAIADNTKGDLFWIGEILLAELEKETEFKLEKVN